MSKPALAAAFAAVVLLGAVSPAVAGDGSLIRAADLERARTWSCQSMFGAWRSPPSPSPRHESFRRRVRALEVWRARRVACERRVRELRGRVVYRLNQGLARRAPDSPLAGQGAPLERAAWRSDVNPFFMVGASGFESSLGIHACSGNPFNIWGLGACDRNWDAPTFSSWRQAFAYYGSFIRRLWPAASTVFELHGYCPPCGSQAWGSHALGWMQQLFGDDLGPGLRYRAQLRQLAAVAR